MERERLAQTQDAFAAAGGIGKRALIHYEKGERAPDAVFLSAISAIGADVLYIITGRREAAAPGQATENAGGGAGRSAAARERALLDNYRASSDAGRRVVEGAASLAAQSQALNPGKDPGGRAA